MRLRNSWVLIALFLLAANFNVLGQDGTSGEKIQIQLINKIKTKGAIYSSPICTPDTHVVVGSHDKNIYFMDRFGNLVTKFKTGGWVHATPSIVYDSLVVIGSYDKNLYFFNTKGMLIKSVQNIGRIFTQVCEFSNGALVYGVSKTIQFYHPEEKFESSIQLKKLIHGSPYIQGDSLVYIGGNDKNLYRINQSGDIISKLATQGWIMHAKTTPLKCGNLVIPSYDGSLYFIDPDGNLIKEFKTNGSLHGNPLQLEDGTIVIGSMDQNIYLLDENGNLKHTIPTKGKVVSSPVKLARNIFCLGSFDRKLYIINTQGEILSTYTLGGRIFSSPVLVDNTTLAMGCNDKCIYFLKINGLPLYANPNGTFSSIKLLTF